MSFPTYSISGETLLRHSGRKESKSFNHFLNAVNVKAKLRTNKTSKQGADLPPGGDASFASVLSQRCLQEKNGDATKDQKNKVWDEEYTCM